MKQAQPLGFRPRRVDRLLSKTKSCHSAASKINVLSRYFLGHPYTVNPLIGSPERPETFVASIDGFDCVTYVETILALSRASQSGEFPDWLRKIRYDGGRVKWSSRNHYMTDWIR